MILSILFTQTVEEVLNDKNKDLGFHVLSEEINSLLSYMTNEVSSSKDRLLKFKIAN